MKWLKVGIEVIVLKKCDKFSTSDKVLLDKELIVRETVTVTTGRQGFSSCSFNSKNPCQTPRYACFLKNVV